MNHIQSATDTLTAWCDSPLSAVEFYFKTIDQAALNGLFPDKKTACKECIMKVMDALLNNIEVNHD